MPIKLAQVIDTAIQLQLQIRNPVDDADNLIGVFHRIPGDISPDEYQEFVKRNLETYTKTVLESLKDGFR